MGVFKVRFIRLPDLPFMGEGNSSLMEEDVEARVGIEPTHKGFADLIPFVNPLYSCGSICPWPFPVRFLSDLCSIMLPANLKSGESILAADRLQGFCRTNGSYLPPGPQHTARAP
jgi:hypothetical protein